MRQSQLFGRTTKNKQPDATSANHDLLTRGGFIDQLMAGVYSYLPLGLRVLNHVAGIVREEMSAIGAQEVLLPALHPKKNWEQTGRYDNVDILFKLESQTQSEYVLGMSHEEVIVPLAKRFIASYRDLPGAWYQIQTKFRDELRAKAGLLRGREFLMKDLYSFHATSDDLKEYYARVREAYLKIFEKCGLDAIVTEASGGSFTDEFSHEFQVATPNGEDIIFTCSSCDFAQNKEVSKVKAGDACPKCGKKIKELKTIEVGNIFDLKTKFSKDFDLTFTDEAGNKKDVIIGCYGIGVSRLMGSIVEVHNDERGIVWPESVAPFKVHLLTFSDDAAVAAQSKEVYDSLTSAGIGTLWDERNTVSNGEKLADADLIGIPHRMIISKKTEGMIEYKKRKESKTQKITNKEALSIIH